MEKLSLDLSYNSKNKIKYDRIICELIREGWILESTYVDHKKGKGNYYYRTIIRRLSE